MSHHMNFKLTVGPCVVVTMRALVRPDVYQVAKIKCKQITNTISGISVNLNYCKFAIVLFLFCSARASVTA